MDELITDELSPNSFAAPPPVPPTAANVEVCNVRVMVRIRPFSATEISLGDPSKDPPVTSILYVAKNNTVVVLDPNNNYNPSSDSFQYDHVFWSVAEDQKQMIGPGTTFGGQEDVFNIVGLPVLEAVMHGRNSCVFAYGQTGSGKTYTMLGSPGEAGLIPRIIDHLFQKMLVGGPAHIEYTVSASFLEIYNEKVKDLLNAAELKVHAKEAGFCERKVRFNPTLGTYVEGLKRTEITTAEECNSVLEAGTSYRTTAATAMNDTSSRSHAILQLNIRRKDNHEGVISTAILNLVDLAGSERIRMSGVTGQQLTEAKKINLSLTTLRRVIDTLLENSHRHESQRKAVAPYRESMLTWVLADSLGGNCRTTMLGTASPHMRNTEDTINTLRYALKARSIACVVKVNEEKFAVTLNALRSEMDQMKQQLEMNSSMFREESSYFVTKELEMSEKRGQLLSEKEGKQAMAGSLRKEVVQREVQLRKMATELEAKKRVASEADELQRERAKVAALFAEARRRIAEEEILNERLETEIKRAQELELEIQDLQVKQREIEKRAIEESEREKKKVFATIFRISTRFGEDRQSIEESKVQLEALRKKESELHYKIERANAKIELRSEDIKVLKRYCEESENRIFSTNKAINDTLSYRSSRLKDIGLDMEETKKSKARVQAKLQAVQEEIELYYKEKLPQSLESLGAAYKARDKHQFEGGSVVREDTEVDLELKRLEQHLVIDKCRLQDEVGRNRRAAAALSEFSATASATGLRLATVQSDIDVLEKEVPEIFGDISKIAEARKVLLDQKLKLETLFRSLLPIQDSLQLYVKQRSTALVNQEDRLREKDAAISATRMKRLERIAKEQEEHKEAVAKQLQNKVELLDSGLSHQKLSETALGKAPYINIATTTRHLQRAPSPALRRAASQIEKQHRLDTPMFAGTTTPHRTRFSKGTSQSSSAPKT